MHYLRNSILINSGDILDRHPKIQIVLLIRYHSLISLRHIAHQMILHQRMQSNPFTMLPKLEPSGIHQLRALAAAGWQLDIRQWGYFKENEWCTLPIAFTESLITLATHESANVAAAKGASYVCTTIIDENKIYIYTPVDKNNSSNAIIICH